MKILVEDLAFEVMDDFLRAAFEQFGQVTVASIAREQHSSDSKGCAVIEMPVEAEARAAIEGLNGKEIMGRAIIVKEAVPLVIEPPKTGSGNSLYAPEPRPQQERVRRPIYRDEERPGSRRGQRPGQRPGSRQGSRPSSRRRTN